MDPRKEQPNLSFVEVFLISQVFLGISIIFFMPIFSYETIQPLHLLLGGEDPESKIGTFLVGFFICIKLVFLLGGLGWGFAAINLHLKRRSDKLISHSQIAFLAIGSVLLLGSFTLSYFIF